MKETTPRFCSGCGRSSQLRSGNLRRYQFYGSFNIHLNVESMEWLTLLYVAINLVLTGCDSECANLQALHGYCMTEPQMVSFEV